ncbi:MAG: rhomboid family intramembrane serine protease [Anaerolineaceae bacterium]|nr:rhomboid family intramembrane serine protease [Anaerolineaceae bacterium]
MFPIKDSVHARSFPFINWMIIILNTLVFFFQTNLSPSGLEQFIETFALIPAHIDPSHPLSLLPLLTHIWLHGSLFHLISNMWMLFIFGDNVEDRMGSLRYLLFYLLGGISAGLLQYFFTVDPNVPAIGASGAIAAVMGSYFLFYPRSRVVTFVPILIVPWIVHIPSFIFLGVWFITQLFSGMTEWTASAGGMGGVAWWAHVGGFLFGLTVSSLFCIGRKKRRTYADEYYPW